MSGETLFHPHAGGPTFAVHAVDLEVQKGPDLGRRARVDRPTFIVGTGVSADLRLSDGTVSREHLRLFLDPLGLRIRDEGSKNGTWLSGLRLSDGLLTQGTTLELGNTTLKVHLESGPLDLPLSSEGHFGRALGVSASMRHLFAVLERAARSDVTVLLEGESGVGKEVLARSLHESSARAEGPFIAVDCGAIPANLMEAELFGHEKGAFTGADAPRLGLFEQAQGGTLFLDEVGELPLEMQPKLLRVLETKEVRPLGGTAVRKLDCRVVAATNRRLHESSQKGEFRQDLYYRLAVARVTVPPLRDRPDDVLPLATELLRVAQRDRSAVLPTDLAALLLGYRWPGNVRELRNVVERFALLGVRDAPALFDAQAQERGGAADLSTLPYHEARRVALERFERSYLPAVLTRAGGVVAKAAELAEVARPSFYRMLDRIRPPGEHRGEEEPPEGR
ncbi:MAG: sigma 54-interacting transcriptional regulator [Deltaproteobacteria bacterium]|nr:sigma 54-interacting transcriptional regulator [Deltaproteobacteria bacterium]